MNLRHTTFWLLLFLSFSTVASAQQATKADLQALEIRMSNLEIKVDEMDKRLTNKIEELDKRLTAQIQAVNVRIDELERHLSTLINLLIGVVLAAIALPQVLGYLLGRREREELQKQLQDQRTETQQQIQGLRTEIRDLGGRLDRQFQVVFEKLSQQQQEIDNLKSHRIVTPS